MGTETAKSTGRKLAGDARGAYAGAGCMASRLRWHVVISSVLVVASCGGRSSLFGLAGAGGGHGVSTTTGAGVSGGGGVAGGPTTGASGGGGGGSPPIDQVVSITPGGYVEVEPSLAVDASGVVVVDWITFTAPETMAAPHPPTSVGYAVSLDDGATFAPPAQVFSPGGGLAAAPTVTVDAAGAFHVAWLGYRVGAMGDRIDTRVYVSSATSTGGALVLGPPVEASDPVEMTAVRDRPWVASSPGGSLLVAYSSRTPTSLGIDVARSADGGQTWTHGSLADPSTLGEIASLCSGSGSPARLFAAYVGAAVPGGDLQVGLSWSDDDGLTWAPSAASIVSAPGEAVAFDRPACVAQGSDVWVLYALTGDAGQDDPVELAIQLARSSDGGQTIAARSQVGDTSLAPLFLHPQMVREPGTGALDFSFYAGHGGVDEGGLFAWSRAADPGAPPSMAEVIHTPVEFSDLSAGPHWLGDSSGLFTRAGKLYASYTSNATGRSHVAFARRRLP